MPRYERQIMLTELKECLKGSPYIFISCVKGLKVAEVSELRRNLESKVQRSLLVKNSLLRLTLKETNASDEAKNLVDGQVLAVFANKEPQDVSKVLVDYVKKNEKFVLRGAILDGTTVNVNYVKQLAGLPSRQELLTKVVCGMNAPIAGFVLTLGALIRSLAIVLSRVSEKKN